MTAPELFWRNARMMPDGRPQADLNGCRVHTNVCDMVRWPNGAEECAICARERQPEASMQNAAFRMKPYWEWVQ